MEKRTEKMEKRMEKMERKRRDIEESDAFLELRYSTSECYCGYKKDVLHRKNIHDYDNIGLWEHIAKQGSIITEEHTKLIWDSFIEDLKNPITEIGDLYEEFIEWCDGNVKELREGTREILRNRQRDWEADFIDVNGSIEELLDYAQNLGQEEKLEAQKTSTLDSLCQNLPGGQKEGIAHDLSQLLCIMEKNTHGGLEPEDVKIIETNLPKWKKQIQEMRISLENVL